MALADLQQSVQDLVRDRDGVLSSPERDRAIAAAVGTYSRDRPRLLVVDVEAVGTRRLPLPTGWVQDFSALAQIEYPIDQIPAAKIDVARTQFYRGPSGLLIEVPDAILSGADVRITFSAPHTVDSATDTTPSADRHAIACLASAMLCEQLASHYATESAPTIGADTVNHADKSRTFAGRARSYRKEYETQLRIDTTRQVSASVVVDLDNTNSDGTARLFHPRLLRR